VLPAAFADSQLNPIVLSVSDAEQTMPKEIISNAKRKGERVRESFVDDSTPPAHEESLFLHQNDFWIIRFHGRSALLRSTRGLHCLAVLLRNPGREFHVRELLTCPVDASTPAAVLTVHESVRSQLYAGIPMLDARAKAEYRSRLNELRQDLNEAERFNDPSRRIKVQNEIQAITDCLAAAVGVGGGDRKISSDVERARSAVTKCIRKAIQKIDDTIPSLGYHLEARIKTGYFCSYNPHPERPVNWKF
jgi:hypothetical protein